MHNHENSIPKGFWTLHRIYSIILLCFAVFMVAVVIPTGIEEGYDTGTMSGSFVPTVFSILLGGVAVLQILQSNRNDTVSTDDSVDVPSSTHVKRAILCFVIICLFVYGLDILGFVGATVPFAAAILSMTGNRFKVQWFFAFAFVPLLWFVAEYMLEIPLP